MRYLLEYLVRSGISVPRRIVVDVPTRHLGPDLWSIQPGVVWEFIARTKTASGHLTGAYRMDLGSVNAPPPLEHRDPGVGWSCIAPESKFSYCFRTGKAQAASFKLDNRSGIV